MHGRLLFAATLVTFAAPARAQSADASAPPFTINGSATIASDYRFRGGSQNDGGMAVQGIIRAFVLAGTPFIAKAHIRDSRGKPGLGSNATRVALTGRYSDRSLGTDATWRDLTLGLTYGDTDTSDRDAAYLRPSFSRGRDGTGNIAGGTALVSLTAAS